MQIIRHRERKTEVRYSRLFEREAQPGSGFLFQCNEAGVVDVASLAPAGRANYAACLAGQLDCGAKLIDRGVDRTVHRWTEDAVGRCACGAEVVLAGFTNTCDRCGADYNQSGQRLADRSQWGEETGESLSEVLAIH